MKYFFSFQKALFLISFPTLLQAQIKENPSNSENSLLQSRKHKIGFFFVGNYNYGLSKNTDASGKYKPDAESNNDFSLRYARLNGTFHLNPKWQANFLFNLADFKHNNLKYRVLEIASVTYKHSPYLNLRFGQFRPYFGVENTYIAQNQKSDYRTNSYLLMGASHWQSFQIGASLYGEIHLGSIPLKYYFNAYNGNGKNKPADDDAYKNFSTRLEYEVLKGFTLGANYATTKYKGKPTRVFTFDLQTEHQLAKQLKFITESQYAKGHNMKEIKNQGVDKSTVDNYQFQNWYVTSLFHYDTQQDFLKALEFSYRYEDVNAIQKLNNHQITHTPFLSFLFEENNSLKASVGAKFNRYKSKNMNFTPNEDSFIFQLQFNY